MEQLSPYTTTIEPVLSSLGATTAEPTIHSSWSPRALEPLLRNKRSRHREKPPRCNEESPLLTAIREMPVQPWRLSQTKINKYNCLKRKKQDTWQYQMLVRIQIHRISYTAGENMYRLRQPLWKNSSTLLFKLSLTLWQTFPLPSLYPNWYIGTMGIYVQEYL